MDFTRSGFCESRPDRRKHDPSALQQMAAEPCFLSYQMTLVFELPGLELDRSVCVRVIL
jgi:hypothetical protein